MDNEELASLITQESQWLTDVKAEMGRVLIGQEQLVDRLLIGLLCNAHVLLEGVPGLAKTLSVNALAGALQAKFSRLQFTPDLLPSDLLGTMIYNPQDSSFEPKLGPVFANIVLADEINRAPAKVQSALLEAMQERQVTLGEQSFALPDPFLVLATQNPIDQEGTYTLPEAQMDRFLFKVNVTYPSRSEELQVLDLMATSEKPAPTRPVTNPEQILRSRQLTNQVYIDPAVRGYIVDLVQATRSAGMIDRDLGAYIRAGASPRATINLALASRALAFSRQRAFVTPQDVKDLARDVLRHRLLLSYEAEAENISPDRIVERLLSKVPVP